MSDLVSYAKNEFFLNSIVPGSKTGTLQRHHLEQISKATGKRLPELARSGEPPAALAYLWTIYSNDLQWSSPLTYTELDAWCRLAGFQLLNSEVEVLMLLDKTLRTFRTNG